MAMNGFEKAAIFLTTVGEDVAAQIMKNLDPQHIGKVSMHMARLKRIDKGKVDTVIKEASDIVVGGIGGSRVGGEDYVKKVLAKGLNEEDASKILELVSKESPLDSLRWVNPKTLANFLVSEHPQTIALILCLLEPVQSGEALALLPESLRNDVVVRIATTESISETAIAEIEEVLKGQLVDIGKAKGKKLGGNKTLAEILNNCDRSTENIIFEKLEEQNNELADAIRQLMFIFEDIVKVDDRGVQMILKEVSTEELSLALKTASDSLKDKIFKNMSQRAADILKEDMQNKGPVRVTDVEKAQQGIVKVARKLETEGKIIVAGRGKEELVV